MEMLCPVRGVESAGNRGDAGGVNQLDKYGEEEIPGNGGGE